MILQGYQDNKFMQTNQPQENQLNMKEHWIFMQSLKEFQTSQYPAKRISVTESNMLW